MKKNKPILHDPFIINRVKQYLEENVDKTYLDVGVMTKQLQDRYPEYARRKNAPFRALVEQAYRIVSHSYGMESQPTSGDDSDGSDLEVMDDALPNNLMSNMMNSLYSKPKTNSSGTPATKQSSSAVAIDISSDESGDEGQANGKAQLKIAELPGIKTFRDVTLTKLDNIEAPSKGSTSTSTTTTTPTDSASLLHTQLGHKRSELSPSVDQGAKKRKLDKTDKIDNSNGTVRQQMRRQHEQQLQRISHFNQNSNESGNFATSNQSQQQQQMRQRKYKKEVHLRKSRETFQDVGGMEKTLKELCELLMHIKSPDIYFVLGLMPPRGVLLHGPPGCGKTLLAHAIAGQLNLPLIEIPATELIAGVSGESEERIRDVFEQASSCAPCVLFIDEIDAISSNRSMAQKDMERRIVSQLISSLDFLKQSEGGQSVLVIGATTRPDVLDPALRRVGRFDHEIAIGIPSRKDRKDILTIICDGLSVEQKCDFDKIAELTPGYVGADLLALVSRAATIAVKRKCSEQMRAFQVKAQKNITIVDLDDDADESGAADNNTSVAKAAKTSKETETTASAAKPIEENSEEEKTAEQTKDTEDKNENAPTEKSAEKSDDAEINGATEAENKENTATEEAMDVDEEQKNADTEKKTKTSDEVEPDQKSADADADADADAEEAVVDTKELSDETKIDESLPSNVPEPSLFELLNWLDNPPEDITFVAEFSITLDDFCAAVKVVQPSAKREGFITVPDVTWDDVGSLQDIREELKLAVLAPVKFPEKLAILGLSAPSGVLLCGPPGCGKTLLAKAIANEAGINFISVKGPELMNMYVGESERAVRACFQRARNSAPCVIFFDEFDSLCPKRSDTNEGGSGTRVVNQLLTEMDGVEDRQGVYILAATNRPDIIDPAILRPGRLDTILYVGLPAQSDREEILRATTKNRSRPVLAADVDFSSLAASTDGYTGADLAGLVRQAAMLALKESLNNPEMDLDLCVRMGHFEQAIKLLRPSVGPQDRKIYEKLRLKYAAPRTPTVEDSAE